MNPKMRNVKKVDKVERPRPLKIATEVPAKVQTTGEPIKSATEVFTDLQALYVNLSNCNFDENTAADIAKMCNILKMRGPELEQANKSLVDHYFVTFRNASREDRLDMVSRLKLLELIEFKAMKWQTNENIVSYYKRKINELEGVEKPPALTSPSVAQNYTLVPNQPTQVPATTISVPLAPGEILRSSGKFSKPTKIAGKNIFKDEVVIRNSDSGKVMGIKGRRVHMIEELSDTIISFQRVNPGARDRLVQITGPNEEAISHAKTLVEDTIRRNASPMREKLDNADTSDITRMMCTLGFDDAPEFSPKKQLAHSYSLGDATLGEYSYKVHVGHDIISLSGSNAELLKIAKIALQAYFAGQAEMDEKDQLHHPISHSENRNFSNLNDIDKRRLRRSSSWVSSNSVSPFDSSEDEPFKEHTVLHHPVAGSEISVPIAVPKSPVGYMSTSSSYTPDYSQIGPSEHVIATEPGEDSVFYPEVPQRSLSLSSGPLELDSEPTILPPEPLPKITYTRQELMQFSKSPLCKTSTPKLCPQAIEEHPFIIRDISLGFATSIKEGVLNWKRR